MGKYTLFLCLSLVFILSFLPQDAHATGYTLDSSYCTTVLSPAGTWNSGINTCTITGGDSLASTDTLTIPSGTTLTITSGGTISNSGTITNNGGTITVNSGGTLAINSGGTLTINSGTISNSGTITNDGSITNSGTISGTGTFTSALNTITNFGTISDPVTAISTTISSSFTLGYSVIVPNGVTITINSGGGITINTATVTLTITSGGTISNSGTITNNGGTITVNSGGTLAINSGGTLTINSGTISNSGTITNNGSITNSGTISGTGTFTSALNTITNFGTISDTVTAVSTTISSSFTLGYSAIVPNGVTITINSGGGITINTATVTLTINSGGTISNSGTITNNGGTITVNSGGTLAINSGGTLTINSGTISNSGTITNDGSITNSGSIVNNGSLVNNGTITNNGSIHNSGTISGTSIISGTAVINVILALSPTSGAVGTSVTMSGSGFVASHAVTATYGGTALTLGGTCTTDASGNLSGCTFTIPVSTSGAHTVTANDLTNSPTSTFTVTSSVALSPTSGAVGTSVTMSGSGFAASSTVTIKYDGTAVTTIPVIVTTTASGSIPSGVTFTVPTSTLGSHTVQATDASSNSASATYTVVTVPTAPAITSVYQTSSSSSMSVAFTAPTDNGGSTITSYTIGYRTPPGSGAFTLVTGFSTSSPITVTSLTAGTTYDFELAAVNSAGTGTFSSTSASATTLAAISGNIIKTTGNLIFTPSTTGQASLPSGISTVTFSDNTALNFANALNTASGGNLVVGGSTIALNSFTSGTISNVNLDIPQNIGGQSVSVNKAVKISSGNSGTSITITNTAISNANVVIPDGTIVLAPSGWDGKINPPRAGSSSGTAPSGFSIGGTVIEVGSSSTVLVFDKPVTVLLSGVTGTVGYKPAGSNTWTQITNVCGGTYTSPSNPIFPGECFISNGVDTKIVTYHFTTFGSFTSTSSGHGGSTPGAPPSFTTGFTQNEYPLTINSNNYKLPNYTNTGPTSITTVGAPFTISVMLYGDNGPSSVKHVSFVTNIRGNYASIINADTVISWDAAQPLQVVDPHHFFGPITANATVVGNKLQVTFYGTFVRPMPVSDIGIRMWGYDTYSQDVYVVNALQSTSSVETLGSNAGATSTQIINTGPAGQQASTPTPATNPGISTAANAPANDLVTSVKEWAGYSPTAISDSQMLQSMGYQGSHIPAWVMKGTAKYLVDGTITQDQFAGTIKYLVDNHIIK